MTELPSVFYRIEQGLIEDCPLHLILASEDEKIVSDLQTAGLWTLHERTAGLNPHVNWHW